MDIHTATEEAYKNGYEKGIGERLKSCDPSCRNNVSRAYNALVLVLDNPKSTKDDLRIAMEEAIGYLGEVLE